jgi:RNA polymerase sigma-70 factor (ECF subfamily)
MFFQKKKDFNTEEEIISACKDGNREAQKHLYDLYASKFFGICLRYMKDQRDGEEVLTNGFMKIFDNISKYRAEGSFEGWMKRIMVNECLGYIRKNRQMYLEVDIDENKISEDYSWEDCNLETQDLLAMIQNLPSGYRTIFNMYAIEGYSHKEISTKLDISEGTSKSQLSRARAILKEKTELLVIQNQKRS